MLFYAGLVSCCSLQQVGADGGRSRPCGGDGEAGPEPSLLSGLGELLSWIMNTAPEHPSTAESRKTGTINELSVNKDSPWHSKRVLGG